MFEIGTERLRLIPLEYDHLEMLKESRADMEDALGLERSGLKFSGEYRDLRKEAFEFWLENGRNADVDYRWHTNWEVVLKDENKSIGGASFFGPANRAGEVVFGYIIDHKYRNQGYMTEAVNALTDWALQHDEVWRVISFIEKESEAIDKLLKKCGFRKEVIYVKEQ